MGHKRIFTKVMSILLTMVMVLSMIPSLAITAKAEGSALTLYFKLPNGTTAGDWVVNYWNADAAEITESGDVASVGGTWGDQNKPTLLEGAEEGCRCGLQV